jgi:hypothetical protein
MGMLRFEILLTILHFKSFFQYSQCFLAADGFLTTCSASHFIRKKNISEFEKIKNELKYPEMVFNNTQNSSCEVIHNNIITLDEINLLK